MKTFFSAVVLLAIAVSASAQSSEIFVKNNFAINGYDPVAYFTESKPVKGDEKFAIVWKDARWLFISQANASLFRASPEKYAPQYGGYCAYGCSKGYKAKTVGEAWSIVNGKLYLNYSLGIRSTWNKDQAGYIQKADANWPKVRSTDYP